MSFHQHHYICLFLSILQSVVLLLLTRVGTKSSRRSRYEDYQNGAAESHRVGTNNSSRRKANGGRKRSCRHGLSIRFTKSPNRDSSDESSNYKQNSISQNMNYKGNLSSKYNSDF